MAPKEKAHYVLNSGLSFTGLVAWGGIEPPTQGFSIQKNTCLTLLKRIDRINTNQQLKSKALDK